MCFFSLKNVLNSRYGWDENSYGMWSVKGRGVAACDISIHIVVGAYTLVESVAVYTARTVASLACIIVFPAVNIALYCGASHLSSERVSSLNKMFNVKNNKAVFKTSCTQIIPEILSILAIRVGMVVANVIGLGVPDIARKARSYFRVFAAVATSFADPTGGATPEIKEIFQTPGLGKNGFPTAEDPENEMLKETKQELEDLEEIKCLVKLVRLENNTSPTQKNADEILEEALEELEDQERIPDDSMENNELDPITMGREDALQEMKIEKTLKVTKLESEIINRLRMLLLPWYWKGYNPFDLTEEICLNSCLFIRTLLPYVRGEKTHRFFDDQ